MSDGAFAYVTDEGVAVAGSVSSVESHYDDRGPRTAVLAALADLLPRTSSTRGKLL